MQRNLKFWWVVFGLVLALPSIASALTVEPVTTATAAPAVAVEVDSSSLFAEQVAVVRAKSGKACNYPDDCLPSTCVFTPSWRLHQIWSPLIGVDGSYALRVSVEVTKCEYSDLALSASGSEAPTVRTEGSTITVDDSLGSQTCPGDIRQDYVATARQGNTIVGIQTFSVDVAELCHGLSTVPCVFTPHHEFIREVSSGTPGRDSPQIELNVYMTVSECEFGSLSSYFLESSYPPIVSSGPTIQVPFAPVLRCLEGNQSAPAVVSVFDEDGFQLDLEFADLGIHLAPYCPTDEEWYGSPSEQCVITTRDDGWVEVEEDVGLWREYTKTLTTTFAPSCLQVDLYSVNYAIRSQQKWPVDLSNLNGLVSTFTSLRSCGDRSPRPVGGRYENADGSEVFGAWSILPFDYDCTNPYR